MASQKTKKDLASFLVHSLSKAGVTHVFGVPGAKVDAIFDALKDTPDIQLIVCRHEQNAAFMAAAMGRLTGRPGVCIVTSGPGTSNLVTGLATATSEGDPVLAIAGTVSRAQSARHTHQSLDVKPLLQAVCKSVTQIGVETQISEVFSNAFRDAQAYPRGSTAIALPVDLSRAEFQVPNLSFKTLTAPRPGPADKGILQAAAKLISDAQRPVVFMGMRSADPVTVETVRDFVRKFDLPVVETFQAAGAISEDLLHLFYGRAGLFRNQPGDKLLANADVILTLGYDPYEYDADVWNANPTNNKIIHIDFIPAMISDNYIPELELVGSIPATITELKNAIQKREDEPFWSKEAEKLKQIRADLDSWMDISHDKDNGLVQPKHFVKLLRQILPTDTVVSVDVGTVYIYMMRYFRTYKPLHLLCSNGQQTLGVGLPWAIAANLCQEPQCSEKVVSISGDGGFMFTSQELSTAVQLGCNITHFIWNDSAYNMVEFQEQEKYGRTAGIKLGGVDFVKFAEAFGARGLRISNSADLEEGMKTALSYDGVTIVDVTIDYQDSVKLMKNVIQNDFN